eukprot:gene270-493_t
MTGTFALSNASNDRLVHQAMLKITQTRHAKSFASEMDWFNLEPSLKNDVTLVSGFYTLLVSEFYPNDGVYAFWGKRFAWTPEEVYKRCFSIHFIADWKPWGKGIQNAKESTPQLKQAYIEWQCKAIDTANANFSWTETALKLVRETEFKENDLSKAMQKIVNEHLVFYLLEQAKLNNKGNIFDATVTFLREFRCTGWIYDSPSGLCILLRVCLSNANCIGA